MLIFQKGVNYLGKKFKKEERCNDNLTTTSNDMNNADTYITDLEEKTEIKALSKSYDAKKKRGKRTASQVSPRTSISIVKAGVI